MLGASQIMVNQLQWYMTCFQTHFLPLFVYTYSSTYISCKVLCSFVYISLFQSDRNHNPNIEQ
jgi:hypothetical protein